MKMIGLLVKALVQFVLLDVVEYCNLDNIETLLHDFTKSTGVGETALGPVLFLLICWLLLC